MKQFKYQSLTATSTYSPRGDYDGYTPVSFECLNEYGKSGWEIIAVEGIQEDGVKAVFMKREIES